MANRDQLAFLLRGADRWNSWRASNQPESVDLGGASLARENLAFANLRQVNLSNADLTVANLTGADLTSADLTGAIFGDTIFGDTNLTSAMGLDTCRHLAPSVLDLRTLAKSGRLPTTFLRGIGLPDRLITSVVPAVLEVASQYFACFISYSTKDEAFTRRLHNDLQNAGVLCWYAPEDIQGGKKIGQQIDEAITTFDKLLLVLSEASIASNWVERELRRAMRREARQGRQVLFPIRLVSFEALQQWEWFDSDTGRDLAAEVRSYFIPDFSAWDKDNDSYATALTNLLRDLHRVDGASQAPASAG